MNCRAATTSRIDAAVDRAAFPRASKKFTEPREQNKKEIAALKADKSIPDADKKEDLAQLEEELKNTKPIQFKENIAVVLKYFNKLTPLMQENFRPAD